MDQKTVSVLRKFWEQNWHVPLDLKLIADKLYVMHAGWKTRTVDGRMKKKFFLAPDGSSFACRRSGLQHMIREGFPPAAISDMKTKLCHEGTGTIFYLFSVLCFTAPGSIQLRRAPQH